MMTGKDHINVPSGLLEQFCGKYHIKKLAFFSSVLRHDFGLESDIDVLVEFQPGYKIGFFKMARMEIELSEMFGRKADLHTPGGLSRYFREEVVWGAEVQYAQG